MTPRRQRVTLTDVAREAGGSPMTVSRVINDTGRISATTRVHVRAIAAQIGYRPSRAARALVTKRTMMVGAIVPDITNPYFATIVQGIEDQAWERGYSVWLANTNETLSREEAVLSQIEESSVDGRIVCSYRLPDEVLLPLIEKHEAVVLINRSAPGHLANTVRSRNGYLYRLRVAAEHVLRSGKRRFGYIPLRHSAFQAGRDHYLRVLSELGAEEHPEWCVECAPTWQAGYTTGYALLDTSPAGDAIIGGNDLIALGILRAAQDLGRRVPDDVAITGSDDILLAAQVKPSLTSFRVPTYAMGSMAAQLLFRRMAGDMTYIEHLYDEELIVRESAP